MKKKFLLFICVFYASSLLGVSRFKVEEISGQYLYWNQLKADWLPLQQGAWLPNGTLVQSLAPGSLRVRMNFRSNRRSLTLKSETASIQRISNDFTRDVAIISMYARGLKAQPILPKSDELALSRAWQRTSVINNRMTTEKDDTKESGKNNSANIDEKNSDFLNLELTYPTFGSIIVTNRFPLSLPIRWRSKDIHKGLNGRKIHVYLGHDDSTGQLPRVGSSESAFFVIPIYEEGSYSVALDALDGQGMKRLGSFYVMLIGRTKS